MVFQILKPIIVFIASCRRDMIAQGSPRVFSVISCGDKAKNRFCENSPAQSVRFQLTFDPFNHPFPRSNLTPDQGPSSPFP